MGCFKFSSSSKTTTTTSSFSQPKQDTNNNNNLQPQPKYLKHQVLLQIPGCKVYLMEEGEAVELAKGGFELIQISDDSVSLATTIKVGEDLQWPLTKDEPAVKLDSFHYLFTLPIKDGDPLSYGVTFSEQQQHHSTNLLGLLDQFLKDHSCFSDASSSSSASANKRNTNGVDWKEFAPRIEDYNGVLARAIAGGTGQIVRGIFIVSNAYTNQVQKGGEMILTGAPEEKNGGRGRESNGNRTTSDKKKSQVNKTLKRVKMMSKTTEKISKSMLDGVGIVTGTVMKPVVRSQAGKAFISTVPGEVLLASLDAVNRIFDAAEVAEKQAFTATSSAATRMVSNRYGESAGEATGDALATAGHCANTAWNIFKIRKAINPASSVSSGLRTAALNNNRKP